MSDLKVGGVLYHKTNNIKCIIKELFQNSITIELDCSIRDKKEMTLPKTHIGDWLYYKVEDINLNISKLAEKREYQEGKKIKEYLEAKKKEELEQEKQKEIQRLKEIQDQEEIEKIKEILEANMIEEVEQEKQKEIQRQKELPSQKELLEKQQIETILKRRKIENLIHFTRIENLESILINGFIPRQILEKYYAKYFKNDKQRLDNRIDCTCFSVEFPNNYLFSKFRNEYPEAKWAVIEVDSNLLIHHTGKKFFCHQNAACSNISWDIRFGKLGTANDFEGMFPEKVNYIRHSVCRSSIKGITEFMPTSEQAEILLSGIISSDYIKSAYFYNEADYEYFSKIISNRELISKFNCQIHNAYFLNRGQVTFSERGKTIG